MQTRPPRTGVSGAILPAHTGSSTGDQRIVTRGRVPTNSGTGTAATSAPRIGAVPRTATDRSMVDEATGTRKRPTVVAGPVVDSAPEPQGPVATNRRGVMGLAVVAVLALVVGLSFAFSSHGSAKSSTTSTTTTVPLGITTPVAPVFSASVAGGTATVAWTNPSPQTGDTYVVSIQGQQPRSTQSSPYSEPWTSAAQFCVLVQTVNVGGTPSANSSYECVS
jgi:hypothetical protein